MKNDINNNNNDGDNDNYNNNNSYMTTRMTNST